MSDHSDQGQEELPLPDDDSVGEAAESVPQPLEGVELEETAETSSLTHEVTANGAKEDGPEEQITLDGPKEGGDKKPESVTEDQKEKAAADQAEDKDGKEAQESELVQGEDGNQQEAEPGTEEHIPPTKEEVQPTDEEVQPTDEQVQPTDKKVQHTDKEILPKDREVLPTDEEVLPTDEEVLPTDEDVLPTDEDELPPDDEVLPAEEVIQTTEIEAYEAVPKKSSEKAVAAGVASQPDIAELQATSPTPDEEKGKEIFVSKSSVEEDKKKAEADLMQRKAELLRIHHEAMVTREKLQQHNVNIQGKLADYFRKKKLDESGDMDKSNLNEQGQRYLKYMALLEDLKTVEQDKRQNYAVLIEDVQNKCQEKQIKADEGRKKMKEFQQHITSAAVSVRSGKPLPSKDIDECVEAIQRKEDLISTLRLKNIWLKNKLKKKEQQLKLKEELAEGLYLIDFEQLKIENQTFNEKIEERNEELLKFRKKITNTVMILTHLKEKLQFVQIENSERNTQLKELDASLGQCRDVLSRTKQARDALRVDNEKLRQKSGFMGNESLVRDFQLQKEQSSELEARLGQLNMKYAELQLQVNQIKDKIGETQRRGFP